MRSMKFWISYKLMENKLAYNTHRNSVDWCKELRLLHPPHQLAPNDVLDDAHAVLAVVKTGHTRKLLASSGQEDPAVLDIHFLQGFEAIGGKAWRHDRQPLQSGLRQTHQRFAGVGLQPWFAAEPRLECRVPARAGPSQSVAQQARGLLHMAVVGITRLQAAPRHSVEGGDERVGLEVER